MRHRGMVLGVVLVVIAAACSGRALAQCDTAPPVLTGFSFTPASIDTTLAAQSVTCNMTLTDAPAGVASATCTFTAPDFFHRASCTATSPSSGTTANGTWSCVVSVPRYSPSGVWTAGVTAGDTVANTANFNPATSGFPSMLNVTSDPDTVAPALGTFSLVPGSVNVSASSQTVACNMSLTDAKSGVAFASCQIAAPDSEQTVSCASSTPASGTRNNGTFSCNLIVPRYADAGTWTPSVIAIDQAGNIPTSAFMPASTLTVVSSPEDITAPSLTSFSFTPTSISTGSGPRTVTCTVGVADSPAGVDTATCDFAITAFIPPATIVSITHSCTATVPATGTRNSGTFQCGVVFPRYTVGGSWTSSSTLTDLAGNSADYPQADILTVDCAAADAETTDRFAADKQTLSWDVVAGATQYDVYRGPFTNLTDANADHVPDGGYGTCQNSRDGNVTDTSFLDSDVPTAAQKGFFYLVAYKTGGVEKGLGTNSFGTARTVAVTCP